jgi:hypothetical protein
MVGLTITNEQNGADRALGNCFCKKDLLSSEATWAVFEKDLTP